MSATFVRLELSEKNLPLLKHVGITINSVTQTSDKLESHLLSRSNFFMVWKVHGIPCVKFYFFCLEPMLGKGSWMRATFATAMVIFSKVSF